VVAQQAFECAVAVGVYELHDCIPFSPWLRNSLLPVSVSVCVCVHVLYVLCVFVYVYVGVWGCGGGFRWVGG